MSAPFLRRRRGRRRASRQDGGGWSGPSEAGGVRAAAPEPAPARPRAVGSSQALPQEGMGGRGGARTIEGTCSRCTDNNHRGPRGNLSPAAAATPNVPTLTAQKGGSWYVVPGVRGQRARTHTHTCLSTLYSTTVLTSWAISLAKWP